MSADLAQIWLECRKRYSEEYLAALRRFVPDTETRSFVVLIAAIAPVIEESGSFQIMPPQRRRPSKSAWRWILMVNGGDLPLGRPRDGRDLDAEIALWGDEIIDLVACDLDLSRVTSRFLGHAVVLGSPQDSSWVIHPVHVWETPLVWLRHGCAGVALAGIAAFFVLPVSPLIASSVTAGEALVRKMRQPARAYPDVLVAP